MPVKQNIKSHHLESKSPHNVKGYAHSSCTCIPAAAPLILFCYGSTAPEYTSSQHNNGYVCVRVFLFLLLRSYLVFFALFTFENKYQWWW